MGAQVTLALDILAERDTCLLCGRVVKKRIIERIGGKNYVFDRQQCVLLFKKFQNVYGNDFFDDSI